MLEALLMLKKSLFRTILCHGGFMMHCTRKITDQLYYVGQSDRRLALFENVYRLDDGMAYNSYLLLDDKTVLFDCVDHAVERQFLENVEYVLGGRKLDYLVVHHMEPDHSETIAALLEEYPNVTLVGTSKAHALLKQFFEFKKEPAFTEVKENDTLDTGHHKLTFVMAPMVHWPEVMVTYDATSHILFSADAFGTFGALSGNIFADEFEYEHRMLDEARRYYINIVGKYGMQVQMLLKKASVLDISMICPLHGPIWRENLAYIIDKYNTWSSYASELDSVLIVYGSIYGNTENAAQVLSTKLAERGVKNMGLYDVSKTDIATLVSEAFKYKTIVFASSSLNAGLFLNMENLLLDLKAHFFQNRNVALIQNGSWAPSALKCMTEILGSMKNIKLIEHKVDIRSSLKESQLSDLDQLADSLAATVK
jgi:flavorubredoxin